MSFPRNSATANVKSGSLTHILKPLADAIAKTTTAIAPSNPRKEVNTHQTVTPSTFYSPDFDLSSFDFEQRMWSLRVPSSSMGQITKLLRSHPISVSWTRVHSINDDTDVISVPSATTTSTAPRSPFKRILLTPELFPSTATATEVHAALPPAIQALVTPTPSSQDNTTAPTTSIVPLTLVFRYGFFTAEQALGMLLPPDMTIPTGFTLVGHIAHVNIRDEQLPYKHVIGRVLCDKNLAVETVVNKVGMIDNVYRNFQAEVLYGRESLVTIVKEHGLTFELDFSEVYWNSRLHTEHSRVVDVAVAMNTFYNNNQTYIEPKTAPTSAKNWDKKKQQKNNAKPAAKPIPPFVLDLFGGIGPFAIPAAQRDCIVWGSDLNPRSSLYMYKNVKHNHYERSVTVFNDCGRRLMAAVARQQMLQVLARAQWLQDRGVKVVYKEYIPYALCFAQQQADITAQSPAEASNTSFFVIERSLTGESLSTSVSASCPEGALVSGHTHVAEVNGAPVSDNAFSAETGAKIPLFWSSAYSNTLPGLRDAIAGGDHAPWFHHTIMNLPASAVTFLDMYVGAYSPADVMTLPEMPPRLDDAHEAIIEGISTQDPRHDAAVLNGMAIEAKGKVSKVEAEEQKCDSVSVSLEDAYDERSEIKKLLVSGKSLAPPCASALFIAGLKPFTTHCYCFARSPQDPRGDGLNMAEREIGYSLLPVHEHSGEEVDPVYTELNKFWQGQSVPANMPVVSKEHKKNTPGTPHVDPTLPPNYTGPWAGACLENDGIYVHHVRNVAPLKEMLCIQMVQSQNVLFAESSRKNAETLTLCKHLGEGVKDTRNPEGSAEPKKRMSEDSEESNNKRTKH
jgi:hypothetical protein